MPDIHDSLAYFAITLNIDSDNTTTVSYTHLTLPTTPYV